MLLNKILIIFIAIIYFSNQNLLACNIEFSSIVTNVKTGEIIDEHNSQKIIYPASLTKLMTIYIALEKIENSQLELTDKIIISANTEDIARINKINTSQIIQGQEITVLESIEASIIKSFNEASVALAEKIAKNEWNFAKIMNIKAKELGMNHSHFRNPTGLHDDGQFTTALDLTKLTLSLNKKFLKYKKYFSKKELLFNSKKYQSGNKFVLDYEGATGYKTGYTAKAGYNLIAGAEKDDDEVIAVLTGCKNSETRDEMMKIIIDNAFEKIQNQKNNHLQ